MASASSLPVELLGITSEAPSEEAPKDTEHAPGVRLEQLLRDELDGIWRFLRRLGVPARDLEDCVQEVCSVAARRLSEVRAGAERSFLFGVALRVAKSCLRRTRLETARLSPYEDDCAHADPDPERLLGARRARALLDEILSGLSPERRAVFVLFELEGFTLTEIAELLEIPRGTAASRLRRGRVEFTLGARRQRAALTGPRSQS